MRRLLQFATVLVAAMSISACAGSVQDRQQSADQVFGTAKLVLIGAGLAVSTYNLLPACTDSSTPPLCYSESIADILNKSMEAASATVESSERVFAAQNTDEDGKLRVAKAALVAVQELQKNLDKFGVRKTKTG